MMKNLLQVLLVIGAAILTAANVEEDTRLDTVIFALSLHFRL